MGFTRERKNTAGKIRYTAYYLDVRGKERSAGTFSNRKEADRAWQRMESRVAEGRAGDPRRGRQTFERYVRDEWLPNHVMELRTRENYVRYLERVILPEFGPMRMVEILPMHVRDWVKRFQQGDVLVSPKRKGQRATISNNAVVIKFCMVILSAIFTTAFNDQVIHLHPCKGSRRRRSPGRSAKSSRPNSSTCSTVLTFALGRLGPGLGDAKLMLSTATLLGWFGWRALAVGIALGLVAQGMLAAAVVLAGLSKRITHIPMVPFLIGGAAVAVAVTS